MNESIAKVGYAPLTIESEETYTYKPIIYFKSGEAGGRNVSASPRGETTEIYADGIEVITAEKNSGYDIDVELISTIDDIETDWLGNQKTSDGGILEMDSGTEKPKFAFIVAKKIYNGSKKYEVDIYFNCSVSERPTREDKTAEGKLDPIFPKFKLRAKPRTDNTYVRFTQYVDEIPTQVTVPEISESASTESTSNESGE